MKSFFILILSLFSIFISAQDKEITSNEQFWMGYMTSGKISEKYSLWNDFHYVPNGFFVARTGLTRFFHKNLNLTAGYAYLNVPTINEGVELKRNEHPPPMDANGS